MGGWVWEGGGGVTNPPNPNPSAASPWHGPACASLRLTSFQQMLELFQQRPCTSHKDVQAGFGTHAFVETRCINCTQVCGGFLARDGNPLEATSPLPHGHWASPSWARPQTHAARRTTRLRSSGSTCTEILGRPDTHQEVYVVSSPQKIESIVRLLDQSFSALEDESCVRVQCGATQRGAACAPSCHNEQQRPQPRTPSSGCLSAGDPAAAGVHPKLAFSIKTAPVTPQGAEDTEICQARVINVWQRQIQRPPGADRTTRVVTRARNRVQQVDFQESCHTRLSRLLNENAAALQLVARGLLVASPWWAGLPFTCWFCDSWLLRAPALLAKPTLLLSS